MNSPWVTGRDPTGATRDPGPSHIAQFKPLLHKCVLRAWIVTVSENRDNFRLLRRRVQVSPFVEDYPKKVCIQSKKFGKCTVKECQFMHMNVCRAYMKSPSSCRFGEKCRYFHPKQVKIDQRRENHTPANNETKVTQTKRMEEESAAFLGQTQKVLMQALDMMSNMMAKMQASEGMSNNNRVWNNDPFLHK